MNARRSLLRLAALSSFALVQACGGGGDDEPSDTTPPTLVSTSVLDGATGVARDAAFVVTFSEPVAPGSVSATTIAWRQGATPVAYTVSVSGAVVTLTPSAPPLANFAAHAVEITTGVTDAAGNALPAAEARIISYTTADDVAPGAPGTPADAGTWSTATTVHFTWTAATDDGSGVASYWLQVATATDGSGTTLHDATAGTSLAADVAVADGQPAYARVRAIDASGNGTWSAWSDGITVDATAPAPSTPTDAGAYLASTTVHLAWAAAADATSGVTAYDLQVATATDGSGILFDGTKGTALSHDATAADGQTVFARVRATDAAGNTSAWSGWSDGILVDVTPPVVGGVVDAGDWSTSAVALAWPAASDPGPGSGLVAGYSLQVATAADGSGIVETLPAPGTAETYYATSTVSWLENGFLFARVGAADAAGNTAWGAWSDGIRIDRTAPTKPGTPIDPGAYATSSTTVHFSWTGSADGGSGLERYWLRVSSVVDGVPYLYDAGVGLATSWDVTVPEGTMAFARVRALDAVGNGEWSDWSDGVLVDTLPPPVPTGVASVTGSWIVDEVTFSWTDGVDAASGRVSDTVLLLPASGAPADALAAATVADPPHTFNTDFLGDGEVLYAVARSTDAAGNTSAWSALSGAVRVDRVGPVFAAEVTDEGAWTPATVSVAFGAATDAGSGRVGPYTLHVSRIGEWDPVNEYGTVAVAGSPASFDATALGILDAQQIYVRVSAVDAVGNEGSTSWSDGITLDLSAPDRPAAPFDAGQWSSSPTVSATWTAGYDMWSGVGGYRLQAATAADGSGIFYDEEVGDVLAGSATGAEGDTVYFRLQVIDAVGNRSDWSDWSDGITIDSTVVGTPAAPEDDGDFTTSTTLWFLWERPAEPPNVASYVLQLGTFPGGGDVTTITGITEEQASVDVSLHGLGNGSTCYARVAAVDGLGRQGAWSDSSDGVVIDLTPPSQPGKPQGRGLTDDESVTFTWAPAEDAESGVPWYEVQFRVDGVDYMTPSFDGPFATLDATTLGGRTITARVRAFNGADTSGPWSEESDAVLVDLGDPWFTWSDPSQGQTGVGTNVDLVLTFSEPMDPASVAAALSLDCGPGCPAHGLAVLWDASGTVATVLPDTADPAGITNVDLLPESGTVTVTLTAAATDAAGNALANPTAFTFQTADETAPRLASLTVDGLESPLPPGSVQGGFTLVATFDEDMMPTTGGIRIDGPSGSIEQRYSDWSTALQAAVGGTPSAGQATYTVWGLPDIRVGDRVTVRWANPESFDVAAAEVLAVGDDGMGNLTFVVANPTGDLYGGGGQVWFPNHGDAAIAWTGLRTLELTVPAWFTMAPGSEARVEVSSVNDAAGNWAWMEEIVQVAPLPGTDLTPPVLVAASPLDGATGVARRSPVLLRFSEPLDPSSLAGAWAADLAGNAWESNYSSDEMGPVLIFVPRNAPSGDGVEVHVPATVRDIAGNALGAAIDLSFTVVARTDFAGPVFHESLPPDGRPVDEVWQAAAFFADGDSGVIEWLDARAVGNEDVRVVDSGTGLLVRGFRASASAGSGLLELQPPPRGGGFGTGWVNMNIPSAVASLGVATYTAEREHGLSPGSRVQIYGMDPPCFNTAGEGAFVQDVPTPTTFTLPTACGDGASNWGGWGNWPTPRALAVELALAPGDGGTGILDFEGNPMAPTGFVAVMEPPGVNRVPTVESLRDLRVGVTTGPLGRQLTVQLRIRDADRGPVTVTVAAEGALGTVAFPSATRVVSASDPDWYEYRFGSDGPPMGADPIEMSDANFPTSGWYPFAVTLDDGEDVTTYVRHVWVWSPADVPAPISVDDGGTVRLVDGARPVVVENTATPSLAWGNVDVANSDFLAIQYLELSAENVGGEDGGPSAIPIDKSLTSFPFPVPLEPTLYAWFMSQLKFSPEELNPVSQGWSIDFGQLLEATLLYGPANRILGGRDYGAARASLVTDGAGGFSSAWDATGAYALEARSAAESAPAFVAEALTTNAGAARGGPELFAAAPDGRFMVTTTEAAMMDLPLANRGLVGRGGAFFAVASQNPLAIGIEAGAYRDPLLDFSAGIAGTTFAFVQTEVQTNGDGTFGGMSASVGEAVAGATELGVTLTQHDGSTNGPFPISYTLDPTGFFRMDTRGDGSGYVSGYLGGAPGGVLAAVAADSNPLLSFFLIMAERYAWQPTDGVALLAGDYRFVEYTVGEDGSGGLGELHASDGVGTFDGAGGFTYVVDTAGGIQAGGGSYAVDPIAERVTIVVNEGTPYEQTFLLAVGPDPDTVFGVSVSNPLSAQILVFSR